MPDPTRPDAHPDAHPDALTAALAYAARGWHVFPLRPGDKRPAFPAHPEHACTGTDPRCARAGRHVTWEERATTDPTRIRAAWSKAGYGIGIAAGPSGLVVVDLDTPKPDAPADPRLGEWAGPGIVDGADVWCLLAERAGHRVPLSTWTVLTPSGGLHLYFTAPPGAGLRNTAGTLAPLVDTRAGGGYVAAPPTTLTGPTPGAYRLLDDTPPIPLPGWLTERLTPRPALAPGPVHVTLADGPGGGDARARAYLNAAVRGQLDAVTTAAPGARNRALYLSAVALGQLVAGCALNGQDVTGWLTDAAHAAGLSPTETHRTITSGLRAGAHRPRTLHATGAAA